MNASAAEHAGEDAPALEVAYNEARSAIDGQVSWLQDMRGRSIALVGLGSGLGSLAAAVVAYLADRTTPSADWITALALSTALLGLVGLVGFSSAILMTAPVATGVDTGKVVSWIVHAGFDRPAVHREVAVQLSGAAQRNRVRLGRRAKFLSAAVICLGVEAVSLPIMIWSYVT